MDELEKNVFAEFKGLAKDLMEELKKATEEKRGVNLMDFNNISMERMERLNNHFRDARVRSRGGGKKAAMFGWK